MKRFRVLDGHSDPRGEHIVRGPATACREPTPTKAFFEQALRPDFAFGPAKGRGLPRRKPKGRSGVAVTAWIQSRPLSCGGAGRRCAVTRAGRRL
jgi:hypothetical protein